MWREPLGDEDVKCKCQNVKMLMRLEKKKKSWKEEVKQQNVGVHLPSDVSQLSYLSFNDSLWMKERETKERSREPRGWGRGRSGGGWKKEKALKQHKKRQKCPSRILLLWVRELRRIALSKPQIKFCCVTLPIEVWGEIKLKLFKLI